MFMYNSLKSGCNTFYPLTRILGVVLLLQWVTYHAYCQDIPIIVNGLAFSNIVALESHNKKPVTNPKNEALKRNFKQESGTQANTTVPCDNEGVATKAIIKITTDFSELCNENILKDCNEAWQDDLKANLVDPIESVAKSPKVSRGSDESSQTNKKLKTKAEVEDQITKLAPGLPGPYHRQNYTSDLSSRNKVSTACLQSYPNNTFDIEVFRQELSTHALQIHQKAKDGHKFTCVCAALLNNEGYIEKITLTNSIKWEKDMIKEAKTLGYSTRSFKPSHAEGMLLQLLLYCNEYTPECYTHVIGVSRKICKECNCMLKKTLGPDYYKVCTAMRNKMHIEEESIDKNYKSKLFKLPESLRQLFMNIAGGKFISFPNRH